MTRAEEIDLNNWPVAILAGGLAKRLRPITETIPKALVSVGVAPFLVHQLRLLHSAGLRRISHPKLKVGQTKWESTK
jgi:NDP-sugar pyrophosphorylase family protein